MLATCTHVLPKLLLSILTTPVESTENGVPSAENLVKHTVLTCKQSRNGDVTKQEPKEREYGRMYM